MLLVMRMFQAAAGNRIESAFMPGVTAGNAFDREPGAAQRAVGFDGLDRVVRARRIETAARPEQRADGELVPADQKFQDEAHVRCDALPKGREASTQRCRRCFSRGKFCGDHDVDRGQLVLRQPESLAHQAPQAIARDGIAAVFTATARPMRGCARPLGLTRSPKKRSSMRSPAGIDRIELQLAAQAQFGAEA